MSWSCYPDLKTQLSLQLALSLDLLKMVHNCADHGSSAYCTTQKQAYYFSQFGIHYDMGRLMVARHSISCMNTAHVKSIWVTATPPLRHAGTKLELCRKRMWVHAGSSADALAVAEAAAKAKGYKAQAEASAAAFAEAKAKGKDSEAKAAAYSAAEAVAKGKKAQASASALSAASATAGRRLQGEIDRCSSYQRLYQQLCM